jgi:peptidoglycan/LPS O-acetylase OafA/YrhL
MIKLLPTSKLKPDLWHAMLISLLRGLAALNVAAAHLRSQLYPAFELVEEPPLLFMGIAFMAGFAHLSVVVFFVLSGWLVGGSLLDKIGDRRAFRHYAIDRITRLWIVLVPVFCISLLCGQLTGDIDGSRPDFGFAGDYSLGAFLGNLVGLQDIVVPRFGGNFALWSLTNEIWYYVMFPLLVIMLRGKSIGARMLSALGLIAIARLVSGALLAYFAIWLLGTLFSRIRLETSAVVRGLLLGVVVGSAVYCRLEGHVDTQSLETFGQDLPFALAFVVWLSSMPSDAPTSSSLYRLANRLGQFFAAFSFTLYVLHVPLIFLFLHYLPATLGVMQLVPGNPGHYAAYAGMLVLLLVASYLLHLPFESNTQRVRDWVKRMNAGFSGSSAHIA